MTKNKKIEIIDEILEDKYPDGLCEQFMTKLFDKGLVDWREHRGEPNLHIVMKYIPEFALVMPEDKGVNEFWFGDPIEKNIPERAKALHRLRDIILSS
jgi:hypothetical protein